MKVNYFDVPITVAYAEAADLYRLMAIGDCRRKTFLDKRHQILFNNLTTLQQQIGIVGTNQLIQYLSEYRKIDEAGGVAYVKKVFNNLEPEGVYS
jgi:replicative DNA helicase